MIKILKKLEIEETNVNIMKAIYDRPITSILLNREKLKDFPLRSKHDKNAHIHHNIVLEVLVRAIKQEKDTKASKSEWKKMDHLSSGI